MVVEIAGITRHRTDVQVFRAGDGVAADTPQRSRRYAVASPKYLHVRPMPRDPGDLNDHVCIGYSRFGSTTNWIFEGEQGRHVVNVECRIKLDDADALQAAVLEGLGVAILPDWLVLPKIATGELEIVLDEHTVPSLPLNAIYSDPGLLSLRARRFLDFIAARKGLFG